MAKERGGQLHDVLSNKELLLLYSSSFFYIILL